MTEFNFIAKDYNFLITIIYSYYCQMTMSPLPPCWKVKHHITIKSPAIKIPFSFQMNYPIFLFQRSVVSLPVGPSYRSPMRYIAIFILTIQLTLILCIWWLMHWILKVDHIKNQLIHEAKSYSQSNYRGQLAIIHLQFQTYVASALFFYSIASQLPVVCFLRGHRNVVDIFQLSNKSVTNHLTLFKFSRSVLPYMAEIFQLLTIATGSPHCIVCGYIPSYIYTYISYINMVVSLVGRSRTYWKGSN